MASRPETTPERAVERAAAGHRVQVRAGHHGSPCPARPHQAQTLPLRSFSTSSPRRVGLLGEPLPQLRVGVVETVAGVAAPAVVAAHPGQVGPGGGEPGAVGGRKAERHELLPCRVGADPARRRHGGRQCWAPVGVHRNVQVQAVGRRSGLRVAGIDMPDHPHRGVVGQHALQFGSSQLGAVGHRHLAGVDGPADTDAAAVVDGHPARPGRGVHQRVEQRPVGDRVAAVGHRLGLPVRRGHRPGVQVIAADHHRRAQLAGGDHLVEPQPGQVPLPGTEPADPGRKPLEGNAFGGKAHPALQVVVVREQFPHGPVGGVDVPGVTGQRDPAERALALAEQRPDVGGHETGEIEGTLVAAELRLAADRVAVVEDLGAGVGEPHHRLDVRGHRRPGPVGELLGLGRRVVVPFLEADPDRQVGERVVRAGLIGDHVGLDAAAQQLRQHLGGVADHRDGQRLLSRAWRSARDRLPGRGCRPARRGSGWPTGVRRGPDRTRCTAPRRRSW